MYLNNNITGQVYSHWFLLCIDCLANESTSSCRNPYQIQICISYMHNDQYIFYYSTSSQYSFTLKNPCRWIKYHCFEEINFVSEFTSRQKFKKLFACEFTAQECRDESEISNNRFKNGILRGSLDLAWLYYTNLIIQWYHNNLLLYSFALI